MCPDPQILSVYLDGELPSPWKEKMQDHFAKCSMCREKLENYRRLQLLFKKETATRRTYVERVVDERGEKQTYTSEEDSEDDSSSGVSGINDAKERVWNKIEAKIEDKQRFAYKRSSPYSGLLRRRLSIPLPAAAAAVVILLLTLIWLNTIGNNAPIQQEPAERGNFILASEMESIEDVPSLPVTDIGGIFQYFTQGGANIIILQLPESKNFFRSGEPVMIRAADYSRTRRLP